MCVSRAADRPHACPAGSIAARASIQCGGRVRAADAALLADAEAADQLGVPLGVFPLHVIEQPPALTDELEQPAPRMVVLCVGLEVLSQVADAFAEQCDLNFGGAGVALVSPVVADDV